MDLIKESWPWYVAGPLIALIVFLLNFFGKSFGVSRNLETMCYLFGAKKISDYFKINFNDNKWGLSFILGIILGGFITSHYLSNNQINLNPETSQELSKMGFNNAGQNNIVPPELFDITGSNSIKNIVILVFAGFLIGFGTRYAKGCTSGHAITGLSTLQLPSLIAVIGFFTGGLIMTWLIFPLIF